MPIFRYPDKLILFIHIPKTGGSSIEKYLQFQGAAALLQPDTSPQFPVTGQHFHAEILSSLFPGHFFDHIFCVVRDPLERLISEFNYRKIAQYRKKSMFSLNAKTNMGVNAGNGKIVHDFSDWVNAVFEGYLENSYILDNHIRPQSQFVLPESKIFLFENGLRQVKSWIDEIVRNSDSAPLPHEKKASQTEIEILSKTKDMIREFYAEDYSLIEKLREAECAE